MKNNYLSRGFLLGLLTSVIVIALGYLVVTFSGQIFPPFRLFDFVSRLLPGSVITFGIDTMVNTITSLELGPTSEVAKLVEQSLALVQFMVLGGIFGAVLSFLGSKTSFRGLPLWGMLAGLSLSFGFILIEVNLASSGGTSPANVIWQAALFSVWGMALGWLIQSAVLAARQSPEERLSRREMMVLGGTALGALFAGGVGLGFFVSRRSDATTADGTAPTPPPEERFLNRIEPAPGTRPEITANSDFYRIDINTIPPSVDENSWRLDLGGFVDNPLSLTLEEVRARPSISQYITLSCISNRVGGDLISSSLWTGVRLRDLLEEAGMQSGAREVSIQAADGFYESVSMQDMMDERTFLVYEMNGEPLPAGHGFPLRIYIPNRFGMKQPKWITRLEVIDHEGAGYWVDRGWSEEAIVRTTSVIDNVEVDQADGETLISGGIAYAGARGISRVELQVDDGPWSDAELRTPPLSPLMWVQWRYQAPVQDGEHIARVRAYDGNGELQVLERSDNHPDGATGVHSISFDISG